MQQVLIISPSKLNKIIVRKKNQFIYYYLGRDYEFFFEIKNKYGDDIEIRNLSGMFDLVFQNVRGHYVELIASLNKKNNSFDWWGTEFASKSTTSTPIILNVTYLFCAKKIINDFSENICFIVESIALAKCISALSITKGCSVREYRSKGLLLFNIKYKLINIFRILSFLLNSFQRRRAAFNLLKPLNSKKKSPNKRIIIRSWFTENTFNKVSNFKDRNFGKLPDWLSSRNHEIWFLPNLFALSSPIDKVYTFMRDQESTFIVPDHYLKIADYFKVIFRNYRTSKIEIGNTSIIDTDISPLFKELLITTRYDRGLLTLSLCVPMLERLKEKGFEIDVFLYSFENNTPEKQFILACRKYFNGSKIIAFQHTTFFPNQLAYHLGSDEKEFCPLPDKIICSGPIYMDLHKKSNFPSEILVSGPNLRFNAVHEYPIKSNVFSSNSKKFLLLALSLSHELAFELFTKLKEAIGNSKVYKIYIRTHPVLSKNKLISFIEKIGLNDFEFADDGIIQDWLDKTHAMILTGASMATLEAVVMGVPVIRIVPDNTFSLDPFAWSDYPLAPVNNASEIKQQLQSIDYILNKDNDAFRKIAKKVLPEYFTKPSDENLKVFL